MSDDFSGSSAGILVENMQSMLAEESAGGRLMLGIVGCPGAGKSTLAAKLVDAVNEKIGTEVAIVVPMDGYHFSNEILKERGLLALKGIPDTFDAENFIALLAKIRSKGNEKIFAPKFDRSIEASIADAIVISPEHKLCVIEGNYLLLDAPPWSSARQYFDQIWFVDVPLEVLRERLQRRHEAAGKSPAEAEKKVESTDLPNAELVRASKHLAQRIVDGGDI